MILSSYIRACYNTQVHVFTVVPNQCTKQALCVRHDTLNTVRVVACPSTLTIMP